MIIQTFLAYPLVVDDGIFQEGTVIIIDALRASTTICQALRCGARKVIPVAEMEQAVRLAHTLDKSTTLLGGERHGVRPVGFDLGNSPREYTEDMVQGKTIIFTTSNGTQVLSRTKHVHHQVMGAFVNIGALVNYIEGYFKAHPGAHREISIVCAGTQKDFSYEDALCAGAIAQRLQQTFPEVRFTDATHAASALYSIYADRLVEFVKTTSHAQHLTAIGFDEDIDVALRIDSCPVVPLFKENAFVAA